MRVLVVDDEKNIRRTFSLAVESMDHQVSTAASGKEAIEQLKRANFDVAFLDLKLSQESGLDILEEIVRASPQTFVVIITAYASVETAVEAMRRRAFDYVPKPCTPEQIRHVLTSVERTRKLERQVADLESRLVASGPELDLVTESPAMRKVIDPGPQGGAERGHRVARDMRQFFTSLPAPSEEGGRDFFAPGSR